MPLNPVMAEDTRNILEQTLVGINNRKEDKKKKELFKLTSNKPCPECLSLVKHYTSALYCHECKFWLHEGCTETHFVNGKCQLASRVPTEGGDDLVLVPQQNEDFLLLTSLSKRPRIERKPEPLPYQPLPQPKPHVKKQEKRSKDTNHTEGDEKEKKNAAKRGRERSRSSGPYKPLLSPLLSSSRSPSPDSKSLKFQQANKLINKAGGGAPIVIGGKDVAGFCALDICLICGGSGELYMDLVSCFDCGECFHLRCINFRGKCPQPGEVWRCGRCSICEKCGREVTLGKDGVECVTCSKYYHTECALLKDGTQSDIWECDKCEKRRLLESTKKLSKENEDTTDIFLPDLEPFEDYRPTYTITDTRKCAICDETDANEYEGNHLIPFGHNSWVHTLCALLTSGTYVICGRLYELQESIEKCGENICGLCKKYTKGATVLCAHRECAQAFHPLCAAKLNGGKIYTNKNNPEYKKTVYLFYCNNHSKEAEEKECFDPPTEDSLSQDITKPPPRRKQCLGEYTDIDAYKEISAEQILNEAPPKIVWSSYRTTRRGGTRIGALSVISFGVKHGKVLGGSMEENEAQDDLLLKVGWKSYRRFWDCKAPEQRCTYCCEVIPKKSESKNGRGAIIGAAAKVTIIRDLNNSSNEENESLTSETTYKAWEYIVDKINESRKTRVLFRGGDFYFGFTNTLVNSIVKHKNTTHKTVSHYYYFVSKIKDETGADSSFSVQAPLESYHEMLHRQQVYRGDDNIMSCEGSSRSAGKKLWEMGKRAKRYGLRDLYIRRDERSEEIRSILSSYAIGNGNNNTGNSGTRGIGSGGSSTPFTISSATVTTISGSPALNSIIGGNPTLNSIIESCNSNKNNGMNGEGSSGSEGGRRGLIHHDAYELPMTIRYRQLLQSEDDFIAMKSPIQGLGMYALKLCTPESMLLEYRGEIIRVSVGDIREEKYKKAGIADYLFSFSDKQIVDATICGANARFVNHCHAPNCRARLIHASGVKHIVIVSKTFISPGDELCYDYNFPIEDEASKVPCSCSAPNCPGFMN